LKREGYEPEIIDEIMNFPRQALHAHQIGFIHPVSGEEMSFTADMPEDMQKLENNLKSIL